VPNREHCPKCGSLNITGRALDTNDGDEEQGRYCYDCRHMEDRLRSEGGVSWYGDVVLAPPHRMHSADGIEKTLLAEIRAAPDDDAPRSIYADWLIERNDPLGTFIALQLARSQKRDPVVSDEEQKLLDAHWSPWIGVLSANFEPEDVAFERGFWTMARLTSRQQFDAVARSTSPVLVEDLRILFDVSRNPPELSGPGLRGVRRLLVKCLAEFGVRWIERAHTAKVTKVTLSMQADDVDIRRVILGARTTPITNLTLVVRQIAVNVIRDSDGSFLIRSLTLENVSIAGAKRWLDLLGDLVDPGVKLEMRQFETQHAMDADRLGLKLVRRTPECRASPK
jgi:uncharacterized protein (TIGR02996 family)